MKIAASPLASLRDFYTQLSHFDPMLREELSKNLDDSPIPASANIALSFAEKLILLSGRAVMTEQEFLGASQAGGELPIGKGSALRKVRLLESSFHRWEDS